LIAVRLMVWRRRFLAEGVLGIVCGPQVTGSAGV
jgi:hypothetical protein